MGPNLKEKVYKAIMDDIVNDVYRPFQILSESSLVEKYNCSKSPVREALQLLCNDGVLRSIPRCGYEIKLIMQEEIIQMLNARYLIEAGFVIQTMERIRPQQIDQLNNMVVSLSSCQDDMWRYWDLNTEFHLFLVAISGNDIAHGELQRICNKLKMAYAQLSRTNWRSGGISFEAKNHRAIIAALEKKDLVAVRAAIQQDLLGFCDLQYELTDFF